MKTRKTIIMIMLVALPILLVACSAGDQQNGTAAPATESPAQNESSQQSSASTAPSPTSLSVPPSNSPTQSNGGSNSSESILPDSVSGQVIISFDYVKQSGSASNQFAVWIEDIDGNYLLTVFATQWTANGGFNSRTDSVALWVEISDIASMPSYYVDAVSGATPQTGEFTCVWDLTDTDGNTVPSGEYRVFIEGTLRWKNYVLYSGIIEIGNTPATIQADVEFVYAGSGNQSTLTSDSPENSMIGAVTVSFMPGD